MRLSGREDCRDLRVEGDLHGERRLRHRHDQAGGDAVAGDVADRHRQPSVFERQDVVEVAADLGRRQVDVRELDAVQLRRQLRQDRVLDVARRLELDPLALALGDPPDVRRHVLVAIDEDLVRDQVARRQQQRHGARQDADPAVQLQPRVGGEDEREDATSTAAEVNEASIVVSRSVHRKRTTVATLFEDPDRRPQRERQHDHRREEDEARRRAPRSSRRPALPSLRTQPGEQKEPSEERRVEAEDERGRG